MSDRRRGIGAAYRAVPLRSIAPHAKAMLYQAGFDTPASIRNATDAELLAVPGLLSHHVEQIRDVFDQWQNGRRR